jgi:hypothetical protein
LKEEKKEKKKYQSKNKQKTSQKKEKAKIQRTNGPGPKQNTGCAAPGLRHRPQESFPTPN